MNRFKKYMLMTGLVILVSIISPLKGNAQAADPGCDPLDPACPIDGGLSLLIAAGIGIGAKKAYDLKRKEEKEI
ncbi:MAG: hypothetical protein ABI402_06255 [Ferruginibacter sp.]